MPAETITVNRDIDADRRDAAKKFREQRSRAGTLVVNLVSSPGAGKTSLLEATLAHWKQRWTVAVLVGDLATDRDAQRLRPFAPTEQLTTGGACHLPLPLVEQGFARLPDSKLDFLFVENVGNLVCPASHDLGEHLRVVLVSTTEGDDKPGKYPKMFRTSDALVVTKLDLLPYVPFDVDCVVQDARKVQANLEIMTVSVTQQTGIAAWCAFLEKRREHMLQEMQQS